MRNFWERASALHAAGEAFVVVTLVSERGHAPQDPGAKAIVCATGLDSGTVGGGKVEARAIQHGMKLLAERAGEPELVTWNLQRDVGMTCGGEVTLLFERHDSRSWEIAVFGAGHVAQALVRLLTTLPCSVSCVDSRLDWLARLPDSSIINKIHLDKPAEAVSRFSASTYFVVMTQGHATDLPILTEIFSRFPGAPYFGAIGSPGKATRLRNDLRALGVEANVLERLRCPIGLPIGSNHPGEIAVSVAAQLLEVRKILPVSSRR